MALLLSTPPQEDPPTRRMDPAMSLNLNTTIGAFQIGVLISYVLFGVTTTQTHMYYSRFPDDSWKLKALVAFVWVCEMANALCVGHTLYVYTVSHYTHPERLVGPLPTSFDTTVLLSGVIAVCVQYFFSFRIYTFSGKLYVCTLIWVMIFLRLLGSIIIFVTTLRMPSLPHYEMQWGWLLTAVWSVSTTNDLVIAATLVVLLRNQRTDVHRRDWDFDKVDSPPTLCSASRFKHLPFLTMKENLFSNSLLASLNSRATLRALNEVTVSISLPSLTPAKSSCNYHRCGSDNPDRYFKTPRDEIKSSHSALTCVHQRQMVIACFDADLSGEYTAARV
ncbi:hypothetical protein B0H13DRAFT_2284696 [Mycena leptocephala]|nr:hypothetical protein B0H13DRAFT_2284696 [Mycena leptocephala]